MIQRKRFSYSKKVARFDFKERCFHQSILVVRWCTVGRNDAVNGGPECEGINEVPTKLDLTCIPVLPSSSFRTCCIVSPVVFPVNTTLRILHATCCVQTHLSIRRAPRRDPFHIPHLYHPRRVGSQCTHLPLPMPPPPSPPLLPPPPRYTIKMNTMTYLTTSPRNWYVATPFEDSAGTDERDNCAACVDQRFLPRDALQPRVDVWTTRLFVCQGRHRRSSRDVLAGTLPRLSRASYSASLIRQRLALPGLLYSR